MEEECPMKGRMSQCPDGMCRHNSYIVDGILQKDKKTDMSSLKEMHERFDGRFNNVSKTLVTIEILEGFNEQKPASDELKSFIESEIKLALVEREKKLFNEIKNYDFKEKHPCRFNDGKQNCECFIDGLNVALSLISKNK